jgi:hypothetical protein
LESHGRQLPKEITKGHHREIIGKTGHQDRGNKQAVTGTAKSTSHWPEFIVHFTHFMKLLIVPCHQLKDQFSKLLHLPWGVWGMWQIANNGIATYPSSGPALSNVGSLKEVSST